MNGKRKQSQKIPLSATGFVVAFGLITLRGFAYYGHTKTCYATLLTPNLLLLQKIRHTNHLPFPEVYITIITSRLTLNARLSLVAPVCLNVMMHFDALFSSPSPCGCCVIENCRDDSGDTSRA